DPQRGVPCLVGGAQCAAAPVRGQAPAPSAGRRADFGVRVAGTDQRYRAAAQRVHRRAGLRVPGRAEPARELVSGSGRATGWVARSEGVLAVPGTTGTAGPPWCPVVWTSRSASCRPPEG